jgi:hypothetical protein
MNHAGSGAHADVSPAAAQGGDVQRVASGRAGPGTYRFTFDVEQAARFHFTARAE